MTTLERQNLIVDNMDIADSLAHRQFRKTPPAVQYEDLQSAAYLGLVAAASKYDGSRPFRVFASFRICGEMQDYLRSLLWNGRGPRVKVSSWRPEYEGTAEAAASFAELYEAATRMLSKLAKRIIWLYYGEGFTLKEVAAEVGLSTGRVYQIVQASLAKMKRAMDD